MKISTRGRYGIRLMLALALNYNNGTIPLKTIAKDQGISYIQQKSRMHNCILLQHL